ncbi:restriction endonuclease subunit S [Bacillus toyonensis]|uniref:Restriction endonuclease subunit S n=1 Tax=Bacillus toyonensis TaxID=155322 RepID=A0A2B5XQU0_9BACI|nr:restriction endonuclease subunit S [Bacillus toyonensis]PGA98733.1 restriction endonuclease subunit S [Bacillus toyonensis]PHD64156.1 restriction endonuclease subunit S [Bacillus toyonensis]
MNKWRRGKLSDLVDINPNVLLKKGETYDFISMDQLEPQLKSVESKEKRKYTGGGSKFQNGDVLFARITPCLENGKTSQVKNLSNEVGFGSTEFIVFRGKTGITITDYVYYMLTENKMREHAKKLMVGTSGRQRVDKQQLENTEITIPDIKTQQDIVSILNALDSKLELNRKINQTLEKMAKLLFQNYFFDHSDKTEKIEIAELMTLNPKISLKKGHLVTFVDMKALPIESSSIEKLSLIKKKFSGGMKFQNNDVLLARITPCFQNGKSALVNCLEDKEIAAGSTEFLVMRANDKSCPSFLYCLCKDTKFLTHVEKSMVGSSGRQRIQNEHLLTYEIPKPDPSKMNEFKNKTHNWFAIIKSNTKENLKLIQIRNYLLPRLISGELAIKDATQMIKEVFLDEKQSLI